MKNKEKEKTTPKNKKNIPLNKKKKNNKVIKAKRILSANKEALKRESRKKSGEIQVSKKRRILQIIKRVVFGVLIAVLVVSLVSFFLIRVRGGTPTVFGYSIQRVTSGSMEPTLMVGDIIVSKEVKSPDEIQVNDIITFKGDSDFEYNNVTHRVVIPPMKDIEGEYFLTTKGDANDRVDDEINFDTVQSVMVEKLDFLNQFYSFFMSPWGLLIFIAALLLIFFDELLTIAKVITGHYEEDEEDEEEEENLRDLMKRIKQEEEEEKRREEELRAYKRKNWRKFDNTSNRKKKNRKKNHYKRPDRFIE